MPKKRIQNHEIVNIIERRIDGQTVEQIAADYDVTHQAISRILRKPNVRSLYENMKQQYSINPVERGEAAHA